MGRVAVFAPHPLLTITVERRGGGDDVHLHAGGQGVWVSRMAGELGAEPILCGFAGGETGQVLETLLGELPGERRLVPTAARSGSYVVDRRNPLVVGDARENGVPVLVDLSSPRLDAALEARPDIVKLNDWELAEYVVGPVDGLERLRAAAERLLAARAGAVIVTRAGAAALVLRGDDAWELVPPHFSRGSREGCGDSMTGALAAALAAGERWERALVVAAAAGAANFLRHGLGSGTRAVVERLVDRVELRPL